MLADNKEKISDDDKKLLDEKMTAVKALKESEDIDALKAAAEDLTKEAQRIGAAFYQQGQPGAEATPNPEAAAAGASEGAKDAEFKETPGDEPKQ